MSDVKIGLQLMINCGAEYARSSPSRVLNIIICPIVKNDIKKKIKASQCDHIFVYSTIISFTTLNTVKWKTI